MSKFDPQKPRTQFLKSGYPTCLTYDPYSGEYYSFDLPETQKKLRGHLPALAPVMAMQAAHETASYVTRVLLPQAISCNNAQDVADLAFQQLKKNDLLDEEEMIALEFGVGTGGTTRYIGRQLGTIPLYGFDWFYGLTEDWTDFQKKGRWSQDGKLPQDLPPNVQIVQGKFQDTLDSFLESHPDKKIGFVHMDADTYESTRFVLERIVPRLMDGAIILFDDFFNFPGWCKPKLGEASAWHEIVEQQKLTVHPVGFALEHQSTVWEILSKKTGDSHTKLPFIGDFMTIPMREEDT